MARIGLYSSLVIVAFGVVAPFFIFKLGRLIGFAPLLVLAFLAGLGYGARVKNRIPVGRAGMGRKRPIYGGERRRMGRLRRPELHRGELYRPNGVIAS